jgi:VIT1/CCC1 family predicted Fe2+/Mn2+ transporter
VITADRDRWVNTMLTEEWGLSITPPAPLRAALITFAAFVAAGLAPVVPLAFSRWLTADQTFALSAAVTTITFVIIGAIRGKVTDMSMIRAAAETVLVGGVAAAMAYGVGVLLRGWTGM